MAEFVLAVIRVHTPPSGSTLSPGDTLTPKWDSVAEEIVVYLNAGLDTTPRAIGDLGTNYSFLYGISSTSAGYATSVFSFCDTTTLNWFRMNITSPVYPYFERRETADSPVCGTTVCDIHFVGPVTVTHSTDLLSNNGQVVASATSSNGTVKYGLTDFIYATEGQTSGTITGLSPGEYTLYAKDENDCTAQVDFTILFKPAYAEHYRITWDCKPVKPNGIDRQSRVRIYEREYTGDVVEVDNGGVVPFNLNKPKQGDLNDKFYPVHPTNATLTMMAQTDYQFLPLYTDDNKKFKVVYETDTGAGFTAVWSGFILPSVYRELFIAAPYPVEFQMADNVKSLAEETYTDDNGNLINGEQKLIKIIAHVMNKTGLTLGIRCGINIFETNHNTAATDDPLDQTYVDNACYRRDGEPFKCWEVLESILRPFGARIYQNALNNKWQIEEIDRAVATYAYRDFDENGDYSANGTIDPVVEIKSPSLTNRVALKDSDQSMEIIPAYGNIEVVSNLNYVGSIVSGGFEKSDLLSPEAETFSTAQGIFSSEEGFKDWSYRHNGTSGGNFGRVQVGKAGDVIGGGLRATIGESVGAFFLSPDSWSGNLRNAYIESAEKPYQYSTGDLIKFSFEYAAPGRSEYEFMILRFMVKLGSNYLQQDLSWGASEYVYRAYPKLSDSLQKFEISAALPDTSTPVDTTIQVRIYFYAKDFYEHGLPATTTNNNTGTDGQTSLDTVVTDGFTLDYRTDARIHFTLGSQDFYIRGFYELRILDVAEHIPGTLHVGDFDGTDNPQVWWLLKSMHEDNQLNSHVRGIDRKFYVDNVSLDALVNGQPPPLTETIKLDINKYINETLEVPLYNFDLPDIVNGKNMYNNYFRLSDGTPTSSWARSGIDEALTLQQILLKVLGGNHSAPTFRMTGSFLYEFGILGIHNYLKLTKAGSDVSLSNTEFTSNLNGWSQTGSGTAFAWTADNSGSAEVTLTGATSSQKIYQTISHSGGYIEITVQIHVEPAATNDREDVLWVVFYNGTSLVHMEKMRTFTAPTSASDQEFTHKAFLPASVTRIGFFFNNVSGTDECTYQVGEFTPAGFDNEEVYQMADYAFDDFSSTYTLELMQISKSYVSLQGTDSGGDNQSGGDDGGSHSGGYSSGYGSGFETILN